MTSTYIRYIKKPQVRKNSEENKKIKGTPTGMVGRPPIMPEQRGHNVEISGKFEFCADCGRSTAANHIKTAKHVHWRKQACEPVQRLRQYRDKQHTVSFDGWWYCTACGAKGPDMNKKFCTEYRHHVIERDDKRPGDDGEIDEDRPDINKRPRLNADGNREDKISERDENKKAKNMADLIANRMEANEGIIAIKEHKPPKAKKGVKKVIVKVNRSSTNLTMKEIRRNEAEQKAIDQEQDEAYPGKSLGKGRKNAIPTGKSSSLEMLRAMTRTESLNPVVTLMLEKT
jgi:hypothetical protein